MNNAVEAHDLSSGTHDVENRALILVVEARPDIRDMLSLALTLSGYRVTVHEGGEAWMDDAMHSKDLPALILLDLSDPSRDSKAFLSALHARWKDAPPILVMTTSRHIYDELASGEWVVLKPFHVHDLIIEIQKITTLNAT